METVIGAGPKVFSGVFEEVSSKQFPQGPPLPERERNDVVSILLTESCANRVNVGVRVIRLRSVLF